VPLPFTNVMCLPLAMTLMLLLLQKRPGHELPVGILRKADFLRARLRSPLHACPSQSIDRLLLRCDRTAFVSFDDELEQLLPKVDGMRRKFTKSRDTFYTENHGWHVQRKGGSRMPALARRLMESGIYDWWHGIYSASRIKYKNSLKYLIDLTQPKTLSLALGDRTPSATATIFIIYLLCIALTVATFLVEVCVLLIPFLAGILRRIGNVFMAWLRAGTRRTIAGWKHPQFTWTIARIRLESFSAALKSRLSAVGAKPKRLRVSNEISKF
jgi:hypothetical protein